MRIIINLEGGIVQGVLADQPGVEVIVIDYDTDGADISELYDIPQDDGGMAEAFLSKYDASVDPDFIEGASNAQPVQA